MDRIKYSWGFYWSEVMEDIKYNPQFPLELQTYILETYFK